VLRCKTCETGVEIVGDVVMLRVRAHFWNKVVPSLVLSWKIVILDLCNDEV